MKDVTRQCRLQRLDAMYTSIRWESLMTALQSMVERCPSPTELQYVGKDKMKVQIIHQPSRPCGTWSPVLNGQSMRAPL